MRTSSLNIETAANRERFELLAKFLSVSILSCFITVIFAVYPLRRTSMPQVIRSVMYAISGNRDTARAVEAAAEVSRAKKAHLEEQIQYVLSIIKKSKRDPVEARRLAESIVKASLQANYDPLFVASVIRSESTFNKHAISPVGAKGLMQILPNTGKYISQRSKLDWHGEHKLTDPDYNIKLGIAYLKDLEKKFKGNRVHALIAYNWGPGNLFKAFKGEKAIPTSSMVYAKNIISRHTKWSKDFGTRSAQNTQFLG